MVARREEPNAVTEQNAIFWAWESYYWCRILVYFEPSRLEIVATAVIVARATLASKLSKLSRRR